ncbi:MAG: hypothetical protein LBQ61_10345 [Spirochaetales bacterium]|jgi:hypothetical protein|nr:hypothetical protein [Spirochaetales bacterium]
MNDKKLFGLGFLLLFAALLPGAAAQEGPVFHRLTWQPVEYASQYEVVVEIEVSPNQWLEQIRKTTLTETFVDCILVVGRYRFRVAAFDLLGRPGSAAEWIYFEVRPRAPEPAASPSPEVSPAPGGVSETRIPAAPGGQEVPQTAVPFFAPAAPSLWDMETLYAPLAALPFSDFNEIYFTGPFQPAGFSLSLALYPARTPSAWGIGLESFWNFLAAEGRQASRYTHLTGAHLFAARRLRFGGNLTLHIRLGGGMTYLSSHFDFNSGQTTLDQGAWNPSAGFSLSLQGGLNPFLVAGLGYHHIFSPDNMMLNFLRPLFGLGWRLD